MLHHSIHSVVHWSVRRTWVRRTWIWTMVGRAHMMWKRAMMWHRGTMVRAR